MKEGKKESDYLNKAFWATIILMLIVTIGLLIAGEFRVADDVEVANIQSDNVDSESNRINVPPHEIPKSVLLEMFTEASEAAEERVLSTLDEQIDELFVPVYAGITDYANFHYSVWGEYSELTAAVTQSMGDEIEQRMFTGFTERVESLGGTIDSDFQKAFAENLLANAVGSIPSQQQAGALAAVTQVVIDDVIQRSKVTVPVASMAAIAGVSTIKVISKNMAQVVASKIAVKFAAKGAVKAGFGLGGAGTGAALGSALGPIGSVLGGITGAVVTYFTVDAVIINIDQYFHQEEFEADLADLVQSMRMELRGQFEGALDKKQIEIQDFTLKDL